MSIVKRTWKINGRTVAVRAPAGRRLLDVLREDLGLIGSKESCGEGECGACTVIVDDEPVVSCILPVGQLPDGTEILTVEGVEKKRAGRLVQQAFIEVGAVQCGFCIPGMIMSAEALMKTETVFPDDVVREYMDGNLCRCTGYEKIWAALRRVLDRQEAKTAK